MGFRNRDKIVSQFLFTVVASLMTEVISGANTVQLLMPIVVDVVSSMKKKCLCDLTNTKVAFVLETLTITRRTSTLQIYELSENLRFRSRGFFIRYYDQRQA